jgi:predicted nucleic acid-binding protein
VTRTSAEDRPPDRLVDTSVAVALLVPDHDHHKATFEAVGGLRLGLAGHAAFETYSVLNPIASSSPAYQRRCSPVAVGARESRALMASLAQNGITGGQVYDALVGATAKHHGIVLTTRDRRAADTYRKLDVDFEILG